MHFDEQRRRALELLNAQGIPAHRAEPAPLRFARKPGVRLRPVYFESFGRLALSYGIGFAMATCIRRQHRKLGLSSWEALAA